MKRRFSGTLTTIWAILSEIFFFYLAWNAQYNFLFIFISLFECIKNITLRMKARKKSVFLNQIFMRFYEWLVIQQCEM